MLNNALMHHLVKSAEAVIGCEMFDAASGVNVSSGLARSHAFIVIPLLHLCQVCCSHDPTKADRS